MTEEPPTLAQFNEAFGMLFAISIKGQEAHFKTLVSKALAAARLLHSADLEAMVFTTVARKYAENGNAEEAIRVCDKTDELIIGKLEIPNTPERVNLEMASLQIQFLKGSILLAQKKYDLVLVKSIYGLAASRCQALIANTAQGDNPALLPKPAIEFMRMEAMRLMAWCDEQMGYNQSALSTYGKVVKISEELPSALRQKSCLRSVGLSMLRIFQKNAQKEEYAIISKKISGLLGENWKN